MYPISKPTILYEDTDLIVCEKPPGLATQSRRPAAPDLERFLLNYIAGKQNRSGGSTHTPPYLGVIHRLDQPVSGLLVFAKTRAAARELNRQLTTQGFGKHYLALVSQLPPAASGTLTDYLVKDAKTNTSRVCDKHTPGARLARLTYQVVREQATWNQADGTLLSISLDTGRHHQIRVQLSHLGCPILGDRKYASADDSSVHGTLCLCAYKLSFMHPRTKEPMEFELEYPPT